MEKIEICNNPQIGDYYLVKTIKFLRNNFTFSWPVMADHHDEKEDLGLLSTSHYHIDWRFMEERLVEEHRIWNRRLFFSNIQIQNFNAEYFSPILEKDEISNSYEIWQYLRDHDYNDKASDKLINKFKERNIKMKNLICPHHGNKLISCKAVNDVITCPQHGLKWNVKSGDLVD